MKNILVSFSVLFCVFSALAAEPTDASVDKLLTLTKADTLMESIHGNLEQNMRQGMKQAVAGKKLTDEQNRLLENAQKKYADTMRQEITWASLKPMYIKIYKETFDQEEIQGGANLHQQDAGCHAKNHERRAAADGTCDQQDGRRHESGFDRSQSGQINGVDCW